MAKTVVMDEIHITLLVPASLPEAAGEAVRQTLAGTDFMGRLREAVHAAVRATPDLKSVRVTLTR